MIWPWVIINKHSTPPSHLENSLAIAIFLQPMSKTMHNEIKQLQLIQHNNIVKYIDSEEKPLSLIMEYMPKGSIKDELKRCRVIPQHEALKYTAQILSGLGYLHNSKRMAHRDLKCRYTVHRFVNRHAHLHFIELKINVGKITVIWINYNKGEKRRFDL